MACCSFANLSRSQCSPLWLNCLVRSIIVLLSQWVEASYILEYISHGLTRLRAQLGPLFLFALIRNVSLCFYLFHALLPYDCCIIDCAKNVKPLVTHLMQKLHWPAAAVPAECREVIKRMVESALIRYHVPQHVAEINLWPGVVKEVSEWVILEGVGVLVELQHVVLAEAPRVNLQSIILVKASLHASDEPVSLHEPKPRLRHIYQIWNIIVVLVHVVGVVVPLHWLVYLLGVCLHGGTKHH